MVAQLDEHSEGILIFDTESVEALVVEGINSFISRR